MAKKSLTGTPRGTGRDTTATRSSVAASRTLSPKSFAMRIPTARVVPTGPIPHTKTMANGQPRPKSRRGR